MNQALCTASGMVKWRMNDRASERVLQPTNLDVSDDYHLIFLVAPGGHSAEGSANCILAWDPHMALQACRKGGLILGITDLVDGSVTASQSLHH
jgi:hypothetical protein